MLHLDPNFSTEELTLDLDGFRESEDSIFILDAQLQIRGYNEAYRSFALGNHGSDLLDRFPFGSELVTAIDDPHLATYYRASYYEVLKQGKPFHHEYECSSSTTFRKFFQTVYPLGNGKGLLTTNHLALSHTHERINITLNPEHFNSNGFIVMCSHCRKTRNHARDPREQWDWIPSLIDQNHTDCSHTLCPYCLEHYYPMKPKKVIPSP